MHVIHFNVMNVVQKYTFDIVFFTHLIIKMKFKCMYSDEKVLKRV